MYNWIPRLFLPATLVVASAAVADPLVIRNVNVVPMDQERVLEERTVLTENGRISEIRGQGRYRAPRDAEIIDGDGRYLIPGMAEMHAHIPPSEDIGQQELEDLLFLYLSNGVTLTRGMLGADWHLELRKGLEDGETLGPRLITSGPSLNGNSVESPEHGAEMVHEQAEAGFDFLKIHPGLTREEFDAIAEAAEEAGIEFAGHVPADVGIERALEAGYASIDHLDAYFPGMVDPEETEGMEGGFFDYLLAPYVEEDRLKAIAEATRDAGVWNVPTETLMHNVLTLDIDNIHEDRPELKYMPADTVDAWLERIEDMRGDEDFDPDAAEEYIQLRKDLIRALHELDAGLLHGSDAPQILNVPGFSIHHEMEIMAAAGLSPYEVLVTATRAPAEFFGEIGSSGTVAEDRRADLVLLEANPLEDLGHLRKIAGVIRDGVWLDQQRITEQLEAIAERQEED